MGGIELMTIDDMINAVSLAGVLLFFLTPTLAFILLYYIIRKHLSKRSKRKKEWLGQPKKEEDKEDNKEDDKEDILDNFDLALEKLKDTRVQPSNKEIHKFSSLELKFDNNGKVK